MNRIITNQKHRVGQWVAERVKRSAPWGAFEALGVENPEGALIAGVVFSDYVKNARCAMHCAGDGKRWLSREFLFACFDYAFRQLRCRVVVCPVDSDNADSIRFLGHLGFTEICRIPEGSGDCDLVVFAMPRRMCRWLSMRRG